MRERRLGKMTRIHAMALLLASGCPVAGAADGQPAEPSTPEAWRMAAITDLDAAQRLLREHTPIPFDTEDPSYPTWLEQGHALARAQAEQVGDRIGYVYALSRYLNGFRDPHVQLKALPALPSPRWPGFVATMREDGAEVTMREESDPDAPPTGARILACEGKSLRALADERVFPYTLNARLALDRRRVITRLFIDRGNPLAPPPIRCRIAVAGEEREIALRWRALPEPAEAFSQAYQAASIGPAATFGVGEPAPGIFWIGVPTFDSNSENAARLQTLIEQARARAATMRKAHAIVIDIRGNGGGNSAWADRLAKVIFGDATVRAARRRHQQPLEEWRASAGNIDYWRKWRETVAVPQFGENSEMAAYARKVVEGMQRAIERGEAIWRDGPARVGRGGGLTTRRPQGRSPFPARVYVLSNGACASSCLDFADTVLQIPGVRLIGAGTSGDGAYVEIRDEVLPSGLATITLPQKAQRGADRGPFEAYAPDLAYDGAWDENSVRTWVIDLVIRDSAKL